VNYYEFLTCSNCEFILFKRPIAKSIEALPEPIYYAY